MTDPKRLAQIGVFLLGLAQLPGLVFGVVTLAMNRDVEWDWVAITATQALFILSLVFASRGWAAIVEPADAASGAADLHRDDLLRTAVPILGLYFLLDGMSVVVGSVFRWFAFVRGTEYDSLPFTEIVEAAAVVRTIAGALLVVWGSSVVALIRWAQGLGQNRGGA